MAEEEVKISHVKEVEDGILTLVITLIQMLEHVVGKEHARKHALDYLDRIHNGIQQSQEDT